MTTAQLDLPGADAEPRGEDRKLTRSGFAWALLECGRLPYVHLISGVIFIPYFASVIIGDAVQGQEQVAYFNKIAGLLAAFTAPMLGMSLDQLGPRKPWLVGGTLIIAMLSASLWFATPGSAVMTVGVIMAIFIVSKMLYAYTEVMHNSMLVKAADGSNISVLSSLSFGAGYLTSAFVLIFFLWAFALPTQYDLAWIPDRPLFGLDPAKYEHLRIAGPVTAGLLILAMVPLLLFSRDHPKTGVPISRALADGFAYMLRLPRHLKSHRNAALFLFSRMIYVDGIAATTLFLGVYAAGVMKWGPVELLILGISKMALAVCGAFVSVALESRFGSKRAVQIGLVGMIIVCAVVLGTSQTRILFFVTDPAIVKHQVWAFDLINTVPALTFLFFASSISMFVTIISAASRTILTEITPPEETGAFFGLYSLSSFATAWLAPMLIGLATAWSGNQQAGFAPVVLFFILGLIGLSFVRYRPAE